jgi:hypothetical protein
MKTIGDIHSELMEQQTEPSIVGLQLRLSTGRTGPRALRQRKMIFRRQDVLIRNQLKLNKEIDQILGEPQ